MRRDIEQTLQAALNHHRAGRITQAEALYRRALELDATNPDAAHLLGVALAQQKRFVDAEVSVRRAIARVPTMAPYLNTLGNLLLEQEKFKEAASVAESALRITPDSADALITLSRARAAAGMAGASEPAARAVAIQPRFGLAHAALGTALLAQGQVRRAVESLRQGLALDPGLTWARAQLADALRRQALLDEAAEQWRLITAAAPDDPGAWNELGLAMKDQGMIDQALAAFERTLAVSPSPAIHSNLLLTLHYLPHLDAYRIRDQHVAWARQYATPLYPRQQNLTAKEPGARRLRVGYVSADFCRHPVAHFITPILEAHDSDQFAIVCYANLANPDAVSDHIKASVALWRHVHSMSDESLARQVREDQIDILVDLSGHTAQNRLLAFARRAAPVQASYLGYPDTTGLATMDFRITDSVADPPGRTDDLHVERLVRLPSCAWPYQPDLNNPPPVGQLPADRNGFITFGSFANPAKVNGTTVELWARILQAVPTARLLLKGFALAGQVARDRLTELFVSRRISSDRLALLGPVVSEREHLAAYQQIDIALDSFPYHGTTTTCEALWMGVPVLSLAGELHVSRVGASLLTAAGLPEFAVADSDALVTTAAQLASDISRLRDLRHSLRDRLGASRLFDAAALTRDLEALYRWMWTQQAT